MITAKINEMQLNALLKKLRKLSTSIQDPSAPNRQIAAEFVNFVFKNFQTEGGMSESGRWEELAPSTVEAKARRGYSMILQNEGELRDSFLPMHARTYAGVGAAKLPPVAKSSLREEKKKGATTPLRDPDIAAVHQYGSADGRIPARPMLPSYAQALAMGMRVYDLWIKEHL